VTTMKRLWRWMIGDCDNCGHSVMYHLPVVGCQKCDCEEYV
jgi:predicted nucleic-acid-binding Zn-ribbon protein